MKLASLTYPGGTLPRLFRKLLKGSSMYPYRKERGIFRTSDKLSLKDGSQNRELKKLFQPLDPFEHVQVIVHGSVADQTTTPFSDLDDLVILDDYKIEEDQIPRLVKALNQCDMNLMRRDPVQHHGHFILAKSELLDYPEHFMPLAALEGAICLKGEPVLEYNSESVSKKKAILGALESTIFDVLGWHKRFVSQGLTIYYLKCMVSAIALLPPLYLQSRGQMVSKKIAIGICKEEWGEKHSQILEFSTQLREKWGLLTNTLEMNSFQKRLSFFSNPHFWRLYARRYSPRIMSKDLPLRLPEEECFSSLYEELITR